MPTGATGTDMQSASKFVRYYVALNNHAMTTGDTAPLLAHAAPTCKSCQAAVDSFDKIYQAGGRVETDGWRVHQAVPHAGSSVEAPIFVALIQETAGKEYGPDGKVKTIIEPTKTTLRFDLIRADDAWIVKEWSIVR